MSDDDVGAGYPADILAVVEKSLLLLLLDIVEVQLPSLVPEEQFVASWVELKVVDLAVVVDGGLDLVESQVLDADRQVVQEVGDDFGGLAASQFLLRVVEAG